MRRLYHGFFEGKGQHALVPFSVQVKKMQCEFLCINLLMIKEQKEPELMTKKYIVFQKSFPLRGFVALRGELLSLLSLRATVDGYALLVDRY